MVTNVPKFQCPNALASAQPDTDLYFSFLTSLIQSPTYCWFLTLSYQMGKLRPRGPGTVAEQQWEWVFTGLFLPSCCLLSAARSACGVPPGQRLEHLVHPAMVTLNHRAHLFAM